MKIRKRGVSVFFDQNQITREVTAMTLEEMRNVDPRTVNRDDLVDIHDVKIDPHLPKEEKIKSYIEQIKNPYCYKDGNTVVKITFADTDRTIEDCIHHYLSGL